MLLDWSNRLCARIPHADYEWFIPLFAEFAALIVFVAGAAFHRSFTHFFSQPLKNQWAPLVFVAIVDGACRCLDAWLPNAGMLFGVRCVSIALHSACEAVLMLAFFTLCCAREARECTVYIPAAYAVAAVLYHALGYFDLRATSIVTAPIPLLATALMLASQRQHAPSLSAEGDPSPDSSTTPPHWRFPVWPVVLMVVYNFAFHITVVLGPPATNFDALGLVGIALVAFVVAFLHSKRYTPSFLYKMALLFVIAGLMCLILPNAGRQLAIMLSDTGNAAFYLFILITLISLCSHYEIAGSWMFGLLYAFSHLGCIAGITVGETLAGAISLHPSIAYTVVAITTIGVVTCSTVLFNDMVVARLFGIVPKSLNPVRPQKQASVLSVMSPAERLTWQCAQIARRYDLTQREQEILEFLAGDKTASEIAQHMTVSVSTVRSHINRVYKKLSIHSRDEAAQLVFSVE